MLIKYNKMLSFNKYKKYLDNEKNLNTNVEEDNIYYIDSYENDVGILFIYKYEYIFEKWKLYGLVGDIKNQENYFISSEDILFNFSDYIKKKIVITRISNNWIKYKQNQAAKKIQLAYKNWIYKKNYLWNPYTFTGIVNLALDAYRTINL